MDQLLSAFSKPPLDETLAWLIIAMILALAESLSVSFGFILVAVSAVVAAVVAALGLSVIYQVSAFAVFTVFTLALLRPRILKKIHTHHRIPERAEHLVGRTGTVTHAIDPTAGFGRITVNGEDWAAQCAQAVAVGAVVEVMGSDGIVLKVKLI